MGIYIGIDTSNYTTSIAICNDNGTITSNLKQFLPVQEGQRGLRQSDAVFAHVKNFTLLTEKLNEALTEALTDQPAAQLMETFNSFFKSPTKQSPTKQSPQNQLNPDSYITAIGYTYAPRDSENSYMPCFLVGKAVAEFAATLTRSRIYKFSHQSGHIMAAIYSANALSLIDQEFIAFHVSGGTTDIIHVKPDKQNLFDLKRIGGTLDLNLGQAIDRAGVIMGLKFPCGAEMDNLATNAQNIAIPPYNVSVNGFDCNLSGLENLAAKYYAQSNSTNLVSTFVLDYAANTIIRLAENINKQYNLPMLFSGGVMGSKYIKTILKQNIPNAQYFAEPEYSSDNAAGIALLTRFAAM